MAKSVKFSELNWFMVEEYLKHSQKIALPIGGIKEHGYLSLMTESLIAERVTEKACRDANMIMAPVFSYTPAAVYSKFPGTVSVSVTSFINSLKDAISSLFEQGFKTIFIVNNSDPANSFKHAIPELLQKYTDCNIIWYNLYDRNYDIIEEILAGMESTTSADHGSWIENFSFVRVCDVPEKKMKTLDSRTYETALTNPELFRENFSEGVISGHYSVDDDVMEAVFEHMAKELSKQMKKF